MSTVRGELHVPKLGRHTFGRALSEGQSSVSGYGVQEEILASQLGEESHEEQTLETVEPHEESEVGIGTGY